mgnify:FL=1
MVKIQKNVRKRKANPFVYTLKDNEKSTGLGYLSVSIPVPNVVQLGGLEPPRETTRT